MEIDNWQLVKGGFYFGNLCAQVMVKHDKLYNLRMQVMIFKDIYQYLRAQEGINNIIYYHLHMQGAIKLQNQLIRRGGPLCLPLILKPKQILQQIKSIIQFL